MWKHYRKNLAGTQIFIACMCVILFFVVKLPALSILAAFAVMEVAAILGAAWAARLKRKIAAKGPRLRAL